MLNTSLRPSGRGTGTSPPSIAFTSNTDLGTVIYSRGDLYLDALITGDHTLAAAIGTRLARDFSCSLADRTGLGRLNVEGARSPDVCFLQRHLNRLFNIIACTPPIVIIACSPPPPCCCTAKESLKEV